MTPVTCSRCFINQRRSKAPVGPGWVGGERRALGTGLGHGIEHAWHSANYLLHSRTPGEQVSREQSLVRDGKHGTGDPPGSDV